MGLFTDNVMGKYNLTLAETPIEAFPRYDFNKPVPPQARYLTPVAWLLSLPAVRKHRLRIQRKLKGLKPPYLLLCNHNSFLDFKVLTMAIWPRRANYVVALDGFIGREDVMRAVGCISKRKFVSDVLVVRQVARLLAQKQVVVVYPEARYSLIGTNAVLPESFGKLLRHLKVPVATLMCHGHHVAEPSWNQKNRGTPTSAELEFLFSSEDVQKLSSEEILERVYARMTFDDFAWRRENKVAVEAPDRAEHLHRVLYQCPHCKTEYRMTSSGARLQCEACGKTWEMDPYGVLTALEGETEFSHAPDWYEWQRRQVRAEVAAGQYVLECEVLIDSLPDSKGFVQMGKGTLRHDANGFVLRGEHAGQPFELVKDVPSLYSVHIEYNYIDKKRDCIDLSTMEDTYFCYPLTRDASVTKVALATEELYQQYILKTTGKLPLVPASAR